MPDDGTVESTLWWQQHRVHQGTVEEAYVIEGTLAGAATGRQLAVDPGPPVPPYGSGAPGAIAFDPTAYDVARPAAGDGLFFILNPLHDSVYALDTTGTEAGGFPVAATSYADPADQSSRLFGLGLDAHSGIPRGSAGSERAGDDPFEAFAARGRFEITVGLPDEGRITRVVVTDRLGRNLGAETPLTAIQEEIVHIKDIVRSRVDPNGVLYAAVTAGNWDDGFINTIHAVRPVPLAPVWLGVGLDPADGWNLTLPAGGEATIELLLDARHLPAGTYRDTLLVRLADGSEPLLVPVELVVEPAVSSEPPGPERPRQAALSAPFPNPATSNTELTLRLPEAGSVEVAVYDVLGRRVALLHEGALEAGEHVLTVHTAGLAAGPYVVRAAGEGFGVSRRVTVVR